MTKLIKIKPLHFLAFYLLITYCSCNREKINRIKDNKAYRYRDEYHLKLTDSVTFPLDSITTFNTNCIRVFKDGQVPYLAFSSKKNGTIVFYDLNTKKHIRTLKVPVGKPNGVGPVLDGFQVIGKDSILVVCRYTISIIDTLGHVKYKYDTYQNNTNDFSAIPLLNTDAPAFLDRSTNSLYISCVADKDFNSLKSFDDKCVIMKIDLTNKKFNYLYKYPDFYGQNYYGVNFMLPSVAFQKNKVLISFGADNYLAAASIGDDEYKEYYAGSKSLDGVHYQSKPIENFQDYAKFFIQSPSYSSLLTDTINHLIYRVALQPRSESEFAAKKYWKKGSLIIMDTALNKVGETPVFDDRLSLYHSFVFDKKLYIGSHSVDENQFKFLIYEPEKD